MADTLPLSKDIQTAQAGAQRLTRADTPAPGSAAEFITIELRKGGWAELWKDPDGITMLDLLELEDDSAQQALREKRYGDAMKTKALFVKAWSYDLPPDDPASMVHLHFRDFLTITTAIGKLIEAFLAPET